MAPSFPESEIAVRKGEVVTAIRQDEDNPSVRATEGLMALLYPDGHPYGRQTKGTVDVVERLTRDELRRLHAERFAPSATTAVVVGDVELSRVRDRAAEVLGSWQRPEPPALTLPAVTLASRRQRLVIPMMNKAQADIAYGFVTIARSDPDYYAFWLMNNIFGQYAMGGRLGESIRERQGMAYYATSAFDANIAPGPLLVRAGVAAANVDRAVASIDAEVVRLVRDGAAAKELSDSRTFLVGAIPRALETNAAIASFLQTEELFGLGLDYDARLPDLLGAVTLDQVNAAARRGAGCGSRQRRHRRSLQRQPLKAKAVFFDVDFTLIYPGPTFRGEGYQAFCARYGMEVDPTKFAGGVASAAPLLDGPDDTPVRGRHFHRLHAAHHRADGRTRRFLSWVDPR